MMVAKIILFTAHSTDLITEFQLGSLHGARLACSWTLAKNAKSPIVFPFYLDRLPIIDKIFKKFEIVQFITMLLYLLYKAPFTRPSFL
jgi:hypothetical protein